MPETKLIFILSKFFKWNRKEILKHSSLLSSLDIEALLTPQQRVHLPQALELWEREREWRENQGVLLLSFREADYPPPFFDLEDFPLLIYIKGSIQSLPQKKIAIIGTRTATLYGKESALTLAASFARAGLSVISGLARGIDTAAHWGALKTGHTTALLGSGFKNIYPKENLTLAENIGMNGLLMTECSMESSATKYSFPRRNRLVAALADALLLIESPLEGGAMITMRLGQKLQRPLFALPGRIDTPSFSGNHLLLKEGVARLMDRPEEILERMGIKSVIEVQEKKSALCPPAKESEENAFLKRLPSTEISLEQLVLLTQLPIIQLNVLLTRLVLKRELQEFPGKIYKKVEKHG